MFLILRLGNLYLRDREVSKLKNVMTVDLEDWYMTNDFNFDLSTWDRYEDRIDIGTEKILFLFERYNVKATFFVLASIAEKNKELIQKIAKAGHEIAVHGCNHKMLTTMSKSEVREDIVKAKKTLENVIDKKIDKYRAPSWSINGSNLWALDILEEEGFVCDSSLQPFITPLSGMSGVPTEPFYPLVDGKQMKLLEYPPTVLDIGNILRIPFSGGLYLRCLTTSFINICLKSVNKTKSGMIYIHPWEMDPEQPRLAVATHIKFTHYYNINSTYKKIEHLVKNFQFVSLGEKIKDSNYPIIQLK